MGKRTIDRVREEIKQEISRILEFETRDPRFNLVSVTEVKLSRDMRYATVYITKVGDKSEKETARSALVESSGFLRSKLANNLDLRHTPELEFKLDKTMEKAARIEQILAEEEEKEEEKEKDN